MRPLIPRVAAIHDLSGFGRSSLCNVLPILSTMGIQACPVPTAVLSTHSGGFDGYTFRDLTEDIPGFIRHWKELGLEFDGIYSGFLGSPRQVELVRELIHTFRTPKTWVVIDPVMGDDGKAYQTYTPALCSGMAHLAELADVITPNLTEASILLGEEYPSAPLRQFEAKRLVARLSELGPRLVTVTGVEMADGTISNLGYDRDRGDYWRVDCNYVPASYPGTGDIFASVMLGSLLQGNSLPIAIDRAVQFISQCIKASDSYEYPRREGVLLERELPLLHTTALIGSYEEF